MFWYSFMFPCACLHHFLFSLFTKINKLEFSVGAEKLYSRFADLRMIQFVEPRADTYTSIFFVFSLILSLHTYVLYRFVL